MRPHKNIIVFFREFIILTNKSLLTTFFFKTSTLFQTPVEVKQYCPFNKIIRAK